MARIRFARADDMSTIARLHADSWARTYRGLMPDGYLDGPVFEDRRTHWDQTLAKPAVVSLLLVAEDDSGVIGFLYMYQDGPDVMMLDNLHINPAAQGHGIGQAMMRWAAAWMPDFGMRRVLLYVLDGNEGACRFYERMGGVRGPVEGHTIAGFPDMPSVAFRWDDFTALAAQSTEA